MAAWRSPPWNRSLAYDAADADEDEHQELVTATPEEDLDTPPSVRLGLRDMPAGAPDLPAGPPDVPLDPGEPPESRLPEEEIEETDPEFMGEELEETDLANSPDVPPGGEELGNAPDDMAARAAQIDAEAKAQDQKPFAADSKLGWLMERLLDHGYGRR